MKVVILAGGLGTRISEESHLIPKPMIEIGNMPIIWHIMKNYSSHGYNDFIICCGYKQYVIKEYFADYYLRRCDVTFDFKNGNKMTSHSCNSEPWKVTIVDTGLNTMTGGRVKRIKQYLDDEPFMLTYGDGVSNVNIPKLVEFHKNHGKLATMTAIMPESRYGVEALSISDDNNIAPFEGGGNSDIGWINGGFMVLDSKVIDYIDGDSIMLEREPMEQLAADGELMSFRHEGFWQCMDTIRDKRKLEDLWASGNAPWKLWED